VCVALVEDDAQNLSIFSQASIVQKHAPEVSTFTLPVLVKHNVKAIYDLQSWAEIPETKSSILLRIMFP